MKTTLLVLLCFAVVQATGQTDNNEIPVFQTYEIGFADASNTVEVTRTLIAPDGKVFYDPATRKLMVLASSNHHVSVAALLQQLNVPPRNVSVTVRFLGQGENRQTDASLTGSGGVIITGNGTRPGFSIQPKIGHQTSRNNSRTSQQLLVASGRQASIFIGEEVPYIEWFMEYGRRNHYFEERIAWQRVGASLVIEPLIVGDGPSIRLRITPELSGLVNNNPCRTRFANVATEVIVNDGVPFSLGGLAENNDFYSRFLIGVDRSGGRQSLEIELTARIVAPSGSSVSP